MKSDVNILAEIRDISPLLASLKDANVFAVPEGYFESLSDDIQGRILTNELPNKYPVKEPVQSVPNGYFENLSCAILKKIKSGESEERSEMSPYPNLSRAKRENVFGLPDGYFEKFPDIVLSRVKERTGSKVVPLFRRQIFRYAAAAAIILGLFTGGYFLFSPDKGQNSFAVVNKSVVPYPDALQYNSEKAFEKGLASLTDDQIINYLENHGSILDDDQLTKNTSVSGMPEPLDYIENEHALEDYLRTISHARSDLKN